MAKTLQLTIAKVGENLFEGEVRLVRLPGSEGQFTVLPGHEAFVTELAAGEAKIERADGTIETIMLPEGGVAEISYNQATVLL